MSDTQSSSSNDSLVLTPSIAQWEIAVSHSAKQYKNSSTAFIAITLVLFVGYTIAKIIKNKKTNYGLDVRTLTLFDHTIANC